jgi:hypothetical protein
VNVIVAFNAVGLTDVLARITAEYLQKRLGQPWWSITEWARWAQSRRTMSPSRQRTAHDLSGGYGDCHLAATRINCRP